jgi:hypothetical protein
MTSFHLHRTLRHCSNVLDIIPGQWFRHESENPQFLFNLRISFEVRVLTTRPDSFSRLHIVDRQPFFSSVFSICHGPPVESFSSFFALREFDVLHLSFHPTEGIFTLIHKITLPILSVSSTVLHYENGLLWISAAHGALCCFDVNTPGESQLIYSEKPAACVLTSFPVHIGAIGRIENGSLLSLYRSSSFELLARREFCDIRFFFWRWSDSCMFSWSFILLYEFFDSRGCHSIAH